MLCFRAPLLVYLSGDHALLNLPVASVLLLFVYIKSSNKMRGIFCRCKEIHTRYIFQQVWRIKGQIVQSWESGIQYKCKRIWDEQPIFSILCLCSLLGWSTVRMKKHSHPAQEVAWERGAALSGETCMVLNGYRMKAGSRSVAEARPVPYFQGCASQG